MLRRALKKSPNYYHVQHDVQAQTAQSHALSGQSVQLFPLSPRIFFAHITKSIGGGVCRFNLVYNPPLKVYICS